MGLMAIACNLLLGYGERSERLLLLLVMPVVVSISLPCSLPISTARAEGSFV